MSAIDFFTAPKGYLIHYLFISRNIEPLGVELNNAAWARLGNMLYLDIKKGEEASKVSYYKQDIGGTAYCMNIISKDTK